MTRQQNRKAGAACIVRRFTANLMTAVTPTGNTRIGKINRSNANMTSFETWWQADGLAEFKELCLCFETPVTADSIAVAKFVAWNAWGASTEYLAGQLGIAA
jgi:hypothetical protein